MLLFLAALATGVLLGLCYDFFRILRLIFRSGRAAVFLQDLIFLLLAPEGAGADHLKALARVSRLLRDRSICEKLRGTDQPDALYALLTDTTASNAA